MNDKNAVRKTPLDGVYGSYILVKGRFALRHFVSQLANEFNRESPKPSGVPERPLLRQSLRQASRTPHAVAQSRPVTP
jgi:hypothetical protein